MAKPQIEPRILKGFRDYLPEAAITRGRMIEKIVRSFEAFGFVPIDTPAIEYTDILLGKGSSETDKQMYRFPDNGGRDVSLRFDLTIPLARFAAMHINELGTPFKRYHIAPVWRAEKPQRGRYREFYQCDFDIIGTKSILADAEILAVINYTLTQLGIEHSIRLNNRKVLNGMLETVGAREKSAAVLRAVDKLDKLGPEIVMAELSEQGGLDGKQIDAVFQFVSLSGKDLPPDKLLAELRTTLGKNQLATEGIDQLEQTIARAEPLGVPAGVVSIDLSIARGLDYYTGTVFETKLIPLPEFGSICSGGRYDNLASLYTSRELPGVGASIGLDRIIGAFEELGRLSKKSSTASVLVAIVEPQAEAYCLSLARQLREAGIGVEVFPESGKLGNQLKYGDKKGIELAVIAGGREAESGTATLKNLKTGAQFEELTPARLISEIKTILAIARS